MLKTEWITVRLCPSHKKYFSSFWKEGAGWYNCCPWYCSQAKDLVCANCKERITINDRSEQECRNCPEKPGGNHA